MGKETESMIKSAILKDKLGESKVILADLVKRAQSSYENVQLAPDHSTRYTELKVAEGIIEFAKKDVFHHACLSEPPGTACKDWQEAGTFAPAMLYCDLLINIKLARAQEKLESNKKLSQVILERAQKSAKEMVKLLSASMDTWTKKRKSMIKKPVVTEMGRKKCYMMPVEEITLDGGKTYPCTPQWRENTCDFAWMWNYHELACQSREKRKMEQKIKSKFTDKIQHLTDFVKMDIPRMFKDARWGAKKIRQPKKKHIRRRKRPPEKDTIISLSHHTQEDEETGSHIAQMMSTRAVEVGTCASVGHTDRTGRSRHLADRVELRMFVAVACALCLLSFPRYVVLTC